MDLSHITKPSHNSKIYRDECTQCFQSQDDPDGIYICLKCFNAGCLKHATAHASATKHKYCVNIFRFQVPPKPKSTENVSKITKQGENGESAVKQAKVTVNSIEIKFAKTEFEYNTKVVSFIDPSNPIQVTEGISDTVSGSIAYILAATSITDKDDSLVIQPIVCPHIRNLTQVEDPPIFESRQLTHCTDCNLSENLWLCLSSGHLGCGRKLNAELYGTSGGNNHAIDWYNTQKLPIVVKMGTITPEGDASIFCYQCDDDVYDPKLAQHLAHFGINISEQEKTEKSTSEMALAASKAISFKSSWKPGDKQIPLSGPRYTGLKNLGATCYLASTVQFLFHHPQFIERFSNNHRNECKSASPAECVECQFAKLCEGIQNSTLKDIPIKQYDTSGNVIEGQKLLGTDSSSEEAEEMVEHRGLPPSMFKKLVAGNHPEFSTAGQQDTAEYFTHVLDFLNQYSKKSKTPNPSKIFDYVVETRMSCSSCNYVKYDFEFQNTLTVLPVKSKAKMRPKSQWPEKPPRLDDPIEEPDYSSMAEPEKKKSKAAFMRKVKYQKEKQAAYSEACQEILFSDCLNNWGEPQGVQGYDCGVCKGKTIAIVQRRIHSFPQVFSIIIQRQTLENWVPRKLAYHIGIPNDPAYPTLGKILDLDFLRGKGGLQSSEKPFPHNEEATKQPSGPVPQASIVSAVIGLGASENAAKRAALAVDNASPDVAAMWYFEHMGDADINDPLTPKKKGLELTPSQKSAVSMVQSITCKPEPACIRALQENDFNSDNAVMWLFSNPNSDSLQPILPEPEEETIDAKSVPLDTGSAKYQLVGFFNHKGVSATSGHYIATLDRKFVDPLSNENGWVVFNDQKVFTTEIPLTSESYQLFFSRIDNDDVSPSASTTASTDSSTTTTTTSTSS